VPRPAHVLEGPASRLISICKPSIQWTVPRRKTPRRESAETLSPIIGVRDRPLSSFFRPERSTSLKDEATPRNLARSDGIIVGSIRIRIELEHRIEWKQPAWRVEPRGGPPVFAKKKLTALAHTVSSRRPTTTKFGRCSRTLPSVAAS